MKHDCDLLFSNTFRSMKWEIKCSSKSCLLQSSIFQACKFQCQVIILVRPFVIFIYCFRFSEKVLPSNLVCRGYLEISLCVAALCLMASMLTTVIEKHLVNYLRTDGYILCYGISNSILRILCQKKTRSYRYNFFLAACLRALVRKSKILQWVRGSLRSSSTYSLQKQNFSGWVGQIKTTVSTWLAAAEKLCMLHWP